MLYPAIEPDPADYEIEELDAETPSPSIEDVPTVEDVVAVEDVVTVEDVATVEDVDASTVQDAYAPPDIRPFTRNTSAALFRTPPDPISVTPATQWPQSTTDGDGAIERALCALGASTASVTAFKTANLVALRPIASAFGHAALVELFQRLRYSPARLVSPPHSYEGDAALTRAFGKAVAGPALLAIRTLLAIPGHFRELARLAATEEEAFALENPWMAADAVAARGRSRRKRARLLAAGVARRS